MELIRLAVPQLFNTNDEHIVTTCSIPIPMGIPPSYNFKSKNTRSNVNVNIHYDIRLEVKAKGLFSDFELQVPIIIGTDSAVNSNYIGMTTASGLSIDFNALDVLELKVDDDGIFSAP